MIKKYKMAIIFALIALLAFLFIEFNTKRIITNKIYIRKDNIPYSITKIKFIQLSDFHYKGNDLYCKRLIKKVNLLRPDVVFLTGDYIEHIRYYERFLNILSRLKVKIGIYAIAGNWEYWSYLDLEKFRLDLKKLGIHLLINDLTNITIDDYKIYIFGVDDYFNKNWDFSPLENIQDNNLRIILAHEPIYFEICTNKFDIMLSGHTHGGQIRFPLIGPLWRPDGSSHYVSGIYITNNKILYVNNGIGTSIQNIRLFAFPEITIIKITNNQILK